MTVKELIKELNKVRKNASVLIDTDDGPFKFKYSWPYRLEYNKVTNEVHILSSEGRKPR